MLCTKCVMSVSVHASPWADGKGVLKVCDDELRLCLDRSSDSDSHLELSELIESITCDAPSPSPTQVREVVTDVVEQLLDRVEAADAGALLHSGTELTESDAREIDCGQSRDKPKSHHRKADSPRKVRRKRDRSDHERKKSRRRSTSCSSTSSAWSDVSRKHRRRHKHHKEEEVEVTDPDPSPRVNPIFLWVKQDDTRIVEVLCEDYDKRNRIRLTKTAHGWRSVPRTERLDSTLSRSSLDTPPSLEQPPALVTPVAVKTEPGELVETKENKHCVRRRRKKKRCDKRKGSCIKIEDNHVNKCKNVDVVNNNNCSVSNNNQIKTESLDSSGSNSVLEPRLRSFGYKKACHDQPKPASKDKKKDNTNLDIDVYTFVSTPKTESDNESVDQDCGLKTDQAPDLKIKSEPVEIKEEESDCKTDCKTAVVKSEHIESHCKLEEKVLLEDNQSKIEAVESLVSSSFEGKIDDVENVSSTSNEITSTLFENQDSDSKSAIVKSSCDVVHDGDKDSTTDVTTQPNMLTTINTPLKEEKKLELSENSNNLLKLPSQEKPETSFQVVNPSGLHEEILRNDDSNCVNSSTKDVDVNNDNKCRDDPEVKRVLEKEEELPEEDHSQQPPPDFILPEPHLLTPEPSPPPVPETSTNKPERHFPDISLQPDTSLDSDTLHLPDTTTKSDSSLLITTNISLGQQLSELKPVITRPLETSVPSVPIHVVTKIHENHQQSQNTIKTAEMLREEEIERQITADLDEDHLLAIEEILQGEECVEDFDDDLPEEYSVSPGSPVNLVTLKSKDQVDNSGIPLSLRTDDFLDMYHSPIPMKDHSEMLSPLPLVVKGPTESNSKPIPPAHQQSKTKFLESILSYPKRCHEDNSRQKADSSVQQEPLYLGVSRKSASPTVSSSDGRKFSSPDPEPKPKRMKIEDITLKAILNKNKDNTSKTKVNKSKDSEEIQQKADSTTKSRLLELLTNENDESITKLDPLTQLKEVLSDPDLNVPDPLLVPRARLASLVANPAKEIPRLLAMKSENLSYPKLLTDPDLLVVSLAHLQSLLQAAGKENEMLKYQQQAQQLLQQQMKQEQSSFDAATATALNQMMWLPYLSQLEAAAMACGNTQDFMAMLNMVFPSGGYSQMSPYMMPSPTAGINPYDYKSQLEFQQAFALWNDAMMQAASNQFASQTLGSSTAASSNNNNSSNNLSKLYHSYQEAKLTPKSHSNTTTKQHQETKYSSARTSPMSHNYSQSKYRSNQYPYTSMFSIPTSTPTTSLSSRSSLSYKSTNSQSVLSTPSLTSSSLSQHSYQPSSKQKGYSYNYNYNYPPLKTPTVPYTSAAPKGDSTSAINTPDLTSAYQYLNKHSQQHHQQQHKSTNQSSGSCKSLMNILSKPKQSEVKPQPPPSPASRMFPTSTTMFPRESPAKPPTPVKQEPPKLKVKQPQHLVDPNSKPRLFNFDEHGEVGSTTGSLTPHVDETHPNLWHPLFSSHQQKSYSSPWQWTTPVTVSGE